MNYIRKFKKSTKALSPVVASIILIAVTVAVSVVVAAWMGGMTIGLMGSAEQVSVTNVAYPDCKTQYRLWFRMQEEHKHQLLAHLSMEYKQSPSSACSSCKK